MVPASSDARVNIQPDSELVIFGEHIVIQDIVIEEGQLSLVEGCLETKSSVQFAPALRESARSGPILGGIELNPSCLIADSFSMENAVMVLDMGLGSPDPAKPGNTGPGHYSHIDVKSINLGGQLKLSFYYGFQPEPGQIFEVISVGQDRSGEFVNAAEGAIVGGSCNVGLRISYQGGDGDDVIVTAENVTTPAPIKNLIQIKSTYNF